MPKHLYFVSYTPNEESMHEEAIFERNMRRLNAKQGCFVSSNHDIDTVKADCADNLIKSFNLVKIVEITKENRSEYENRATEFDRIISQHLDFNS